MQICYEFGTHLGFRAFGTNLLRIWHAFATNLARICYEFGTRFVFKTNREKIPPIEINRNARKCVPNVCQICTKYFKVCFCSPPGTRRPWPIRGSRARALGHAFRMGVGGPSSQATLIFADIFLRSSRVFRAITSRFHICPIVSNIFVYISHIFSYISNTTPIFSSIVLVGFLCI